jgi:hypothetical protein
MIDCKLMAIRTTTGRQSEQFQRNWNNKEKLLTTGLQIAGKEGDCKINHHYKYTIPFVCYSGVSSLQHGLDLRLDLAVS